MGLNELPVELTNSSRQENPQDLKKRMEEKKSKFKSHQQGSPLDAEPEAGVRESIFWGPHSKVRFLALRVPKFLFCWRQMKSSKERWKTSKTNKTASVSGEFTSSRNLRREVLGLMSTFQEHVSGFLHFSFKVAITIEREVNIKYM